LIAGGFEGRRRPVWAKKKGFAHLNRGLQRKLNYTRKQVQNTQKNRLKTRCFQGEKFFVKKRGSTERSEKRALETPAGKSVQVEKNYLNWDVPKKKNHHPGRKIRKHLRTAGRWSRKTHEQNPSTKKFS